MMPATPALFVNAVSDNFQIAQDYYGEIGISPDVFAGYVWAVACKYLQTAPDESTVADFAKKLYLRDLYLACGCVLNSERAWAELDGRYRPFVTDLVRFCYRYGTDTEEIADAILVSLYFPDRSGRQRIASYHGKSSLATWLRVIVVNRAINDRTERIVEGDEAMANVPDRRAMANLDSALAAGRYGKIVYESINHALSKITTRERLMLLWRYEQNLQLGEIGRRMGIHQSTVTRQLSQVQTRLREIVIRLLTSRHRLSSSEIRECFSDVIDNPQLSFSLTCMIQDIERVANSLSA